MSKGSKRVTLVAAAATAAAAWALWFGPRLTRIPDDFRYEADIFSRDEFFDEKEARFSREVLSFTQFAYEVVGRRGDVQTVKNVFDVRRPTGEKIFAVERLYGIDRRTGAHVAGHGDKDRDGYLFAPRGTGRAPFTYWHTNYDAPARLTFQSEEDILGLRVYRFASDFRADQTANLGDLPGVPETRGVEADVHLELWVEPLSGWMVRYEDRATAYYYDVKTRERLHPWNRFRNQFTEASVAEQVARARQARRRALLAGPWGVGLWALAALSWGLWTLVRRAGGAGAVLALLLERTPHLRRTIVVASAVTAILLGLAVMAGWGLGVPRLVHVDPALTPMVVNTALGFVLSGVGLWLGLSGRRGPALVSSGVALALGLATLAEYAFGLDFGIDQLNLRPTEAVQASGRMAPLTAACFVFVGASILLHVSKGRTLAGGLLGSLAMAAGSVALAGYALGLPQAYRLGPWTGMALHTAAGFTALGAGLVTMAWPGWQSRSGLRWVAALSGAGGLFAVSLLYHALDAREAGQVQRLLTLETARAADRAADRMDERILSLRRMAERWHSAGGIPQAPWEDDAVTHVRDLPGFTAVSWVDASHRVQWIVSVGGNEPARGRDVSLEERRRRALAEARRTREPAVSEPVDLVQGGRGFLVPVPLFLPDGRFDGFIVGAFRYDRLMDILLQEIASQGHAVSLRHGDEVVYRRGREEAASSASVDEAVRFQGGSWHLRVTPRPEWQATVRSSLPEVTLGTGLALLALASLCLALAWQAARQAVLLQKEVEAGLRQARELEEQHQAAVDLAREKGVLLQEVHHRVKNNLQVITSLINMQARALDDGASRDALLECQSRVQAIAFIHEKLYQSEDYAQVPFSEYARNLVASVFQSVSPTNVALELALEEVTLAVSRAIPCGLILNELITNALKHAFRDGRSGTIRVELANVADRVLLAVSDNGTGLPADLDVRASPGLGLQLVRMLAEQLDAELAVESADGARFRLTVPL